MMESSTALPSGERSARKAYCMAVVSRPALSSGRSTLFVVCVSCGVGVRQDGMGGCGFVGGCGMGVTPSLMPPCPSPFRLLLDELAGQAEGYELRHGQRRGAHAKGLQVNV